MRGLTNDLSTSTLVLLVGLTLLTLAVARPIVSMRVPSDQSALMLSIDVSGSMLSRDVAPSRLEAAKAAANAFVAGLPGRVRIGLVTFAGYATAAAARGRCSAACAL